MSQQVSKKPRFLYLAVFLFSSSAIAFEVSLTRIFSIALSYHFAFMIITVAMLGIGLSGTALSVYPFLRDIRKVPIYGVLLGLSISISYITSNRLPFDPFIFPYDKTQFLYVFLYCLSVSFPFFFGGLCISTLLSIKSERAGFLYASDLVGAGTGSIIIIILMSRMPPERSIILIPFLAFIGSFLLARGRGRIIPVLAIILNIFFLLSPQITALRVSPYKGLDLALKYPGAEHLKTLYSPFSRIDIFNSPAVRYAPGLSLTYLDPLPYQAGISIDCADLTAVTESTNRESLRFLEHLPASLPYEIGRKDDVLIIEPKGGLQVLLADYYGAGHIFKIEIDPLLIDVVRRDFSAISPGIYDSNTWQGSGRSWLMGANKSFDIIDISFMGLYHTGSFGIGEDYRFTEEAFVSYMKALKRDGLLSITLFIMPPPRMELRIMNTIIRASEKIGLKEMERATAVIRTWDTITIMIKKSPYSEDELKKIRAFLDKRGFDIVYLPDVREGETNRFIRMAKNDYFTAFKSLLNHNERSAFEASYIFDTSPVTDDSPFFYYFIDLKKMKEIYNAMGKKWHFFLNEGLLPFFLLIVITPPGAMIVLLPVLSIKKRPPLYPLLYFALIGTGFMFVEVPLIHRVILPLENPSYAFATVLTSILLWSGIGSILSQKIDKPERPFVLIALFIMIILYDYLFLSVLSDHLYRLSIPYRIIAVFFSLSALCLLMGIPFPTGIKRLGKMEPEAIPWAWAVNGFFSVLSPILAMILAMNTGFKSVLFVGAVCYLIAFFLPLRS
ncbi:MAG: hypothetical protein ACK4Z9_07315 [Thermodesulfovibrionales bacterium]